MISRNVLLGAPLKLTPWRKLAVGSWKNVCEASIYSTLELEVDPVLARIEELRQQTGEKITLTSVLVYAVAETMKNYPALNVLLRLGRLYPRKSVDIFVHVAVDKRGDDLTGFVVRQADQKKITRIAQECAGAAAGVRGDGGRDAFSKTKKLFGLFPGFLARPLLGLSSFILYTLNLWSPLIGVPRDSFGSAMVTNVGALGISTAFAPIAPYTRVPLVIAAGSTEKRAVVRDGAVRTVTILPLSVTIDHRVIDGLYAGLMSRRLKEIFSNPAALH